MNFKVWLLNDSFQIKHFLNKSLTRGSAHNDLGVFTRAKSLVSGSFVELVLMLSLSVHGIQVRKLSIALLLQGLVLRLIFFVVGFRINLHDLNLLVSVDQHLLSLSLGLVDVSNGISLNFVNNNFLLTIGLGEQDGGILLRLYFKNIFICIGLQNLLLRVNLGSLDLSFELKHLSLVVSLLVCKFLVFLILKGKLLVLLFFFVVL